MNRRSRVVTIALLSVAALLFLLVPTSQSVHLYRNEDAGCSAASGELSDDTAGDERGAVAAEVLVYHNTFHDMANGTPVTRIKTGEAVRWLWASSHCHSVDGRSNASMASGDAAGRSAMTFAAGAALLCLGAALASPGTRRRGLWRFAALALGVFLATQSSCGDGDEGPIGSISATQARSLGFYSGFHFPENPPDSPEAVPGALEYPLFDPEPSLSYVRTFRSPGTFPYACEHHGVIGMVGVVIVEE